MNAGNNNNNNSKRQRDLSPSSPLEAHDTRSAKRGRTEKSYGVLGALTSLIFGSSVEETKPALSFSSVNNADIVEVHSTPTTDQQTLSTTKPAVITAPYATRSGKMDNLQEESNTSPVENVHTFSRISTPQQQHRKIHLPSSESRMTSNMALSGSKYAWVSRQNETVDPPFRSRRQSLDGMLARSQPSTRTAKEDGTSVTASTASRLPGDSYGATNSQAQVSSQKEFAHTPVLKTNPFHRASSVHTTSLGGGRHRNERIAQLALDRFASMDFRIFPTFDDVQEDDLTKPKEENSLMNRISDSGNIHKMKITRPVERILGTNQSGGSRLFQPVNRSRMHQRINLTSTTTERSEMIAARRRDATSSNDWIDSPSIGAMDGSSNRTNIESPPPKPSTLFPSASESLSDDIEFEHSEARIKDYMKLIPRFLYKFPKCSAYNTKCDPIRDESVEILNRYTAEMKRFKISNPEAVVDSSTSGSRKMVDVKETTVNGSAACDTSENIWAKFLMKEGQWKCHACDIINEAKNNKCVSCETLRVNESTSASVQKSDPIAVGTTALLPTPVEPSQRLESSKFSFGYSNSTTSSSASSNIPAPGQPNVSLFGIPTIATKNEDSAQSAKNQHSFGAPSTALNSTTMFSASNQMTSFSNVKKMEPDSGSTVGSTTIGVLGSSSASVPFSFSVQSGSNDFLKQTQRSNDGNGTAQHTSFLPSSHSTTAESVTTNGEKVSVPQFLFGSAFSNASTSEHKKSSFTFGAVSAPASSTVNEINTVPKSDPNIAAPTDAGKGNKIAVPLLSFGLVSPPTSTQVIAANSKDQKTSDVDSMQMFGTRKVNSETNDITTTKPTFSFGSSSVVSSGGSQLTYFGSTGASTVATSFISSNTNATGVTPLGSTPSDQAEVGRAQFLFGTSSTAPPDTTKPFSFSASGAGSIKDQQRDPVGGPKSNFDANIGFASTGAPQSNFDLNSKPSFVFGSSSSNTGSQAAPLVSSAAPVSNVQKVDPVSTGESVPKFGNNASVGATSVPFSENGHKTPSFSFGTSAALQSKDVSHPPPFTVGSSLSAPASGTNTNFFSFGATSTGSSNTLPQPNTLSGGPIPIPQTGNTTQAALSLFSAPTASTSMPTFSSATGTSFPAGLSTQPSVAFPTTAPGFSFGSSSVPASTPTPAFSFGASRANELPAPTSSFGFGMTGGNTMGNMNPNAAFTGSASSIGNVFATPQVGNVDGMPLNPSMISDARGFSIGTGGGGSAKSGRRIIKGKRPPGAR